MNKQPQFHELGKFKSTNVVPLEQRETEDPPPLPKLTEGDTEAQVTLRTAGSSDDTASFSLVQSSLWPSGSQGRHVVLVPSPNSSGESVGFGLCELVATNDLWEVAFVARMKNSDCAAFKAGLPSSVPVDEYTTPPQTSLQNYLQNAFSLVAARKAASELLERIAGNNSGYIHVA